MQMLLPVVTSGACVLMNEGARPSKFPWMPKTTFLHTFFRLRDGHPGKLL